MDDNNTRNFLKDNNGFPDDNLDLELKNPKSNVPAVKVYFYEAVINSIANYSKTDLSRELGGVLLGDYREEDGCYMVTVKERINALYTEAGVSNIKFTHDTWDNISQIKEEKYPDLKIVGWFHTHPGFGIFLSDYDNFIQKNFFNELWSIAYVVDPMQNKDGVFGWSNGKIFRIPGRFVNEIPSTIVKYKQNSYKKRLGNVKGYRPGVFKKFKVKLIIIALLMASLIFIGVLLLGVNQDDKEPLPGEDEEITDNNSNKERL